MLGINLHDVVRQSIPHLHPDEYVLLLQNTENLNVKGIVKPSYANPQYIKAQIQSFTNDDLKAMNDTLRAEIQRKCYLYSSTETGFIPNILVRTLSKGGDLIRREDDSWWYVAGMMEDFSLSGWVSVRIVLQTKQVPVEVLNLAQEFDYLNKT